MLTSADPDPAKAKAVVRDYYFFVYQLAEVVKPESLAPYGVAPEELAPVKEAYRAGDLPRAKKLIPEQAIEALTVCGDADHASERIREYRQAGVTLPILMPIGNVDYAVGSLATS